MERRLGYHRLRESLESSTRASRGGPNTSDGGRGSRSASRDVRTVWVLARDEQGRLYEIRGGYRGIAATAQDAAEKAIADVGGLPRGGFVIVRRGSVASERSLAAYAAHRGDEWHGEVEARSHRATAVKQGAQLTTVDHLLARCRGQFRWLPAKVSHDELGRRRAIVGVVAQLDSATRQRAAQVLAPNEPQTGDHDRLATLVEVALDAAETARKDAAREAAEGTLPEAASPAA